MTTKSLPVPKTYDDAVKLLVKCHAEAHDYMKDLVIYHIPDPEEKVVKLFEISNGFPDTNDIWPVRFRKLDTFPFDTAVAIATPDEWRRIKAGKLEFQNANDWNLKTRKKVWPK